MSGKPDDGGHVQHALSRWYFVSVVYAEAKNQQLSKAHSLDATELGFCTFFSISTNRPRSPDWSSLFRNMHKTNSTRFLHGALFYSFGNFSSTEMQLCGSE